MANKHGNSVKNDKKYEALRDKGYSKERSAKIANRGTCVSPRPAVSRARRQAA